MVLHRTDPALLGARQQARLGVAVHQPARADMGCEEELVEARLLILPPRGLCPGAEPQAVVQRHLILGPAPHRDAEAGGCQVLHVPLEGQVEDVDGALVRGAADVAVRREGESEVQAPALARPDLVEEGPNVGGHLRRHVAGQHLLEVLLREIVLALEEEGARQLKPHPHQPRRADQNGVEGADGLVQQYVPRVVGTPACCAAPVAARP